VGKSERKSAFGRSICKREHNGTMDLKKITWKGVDRIDLPENMNKLRDLVNTVIKFRVP